MMNDLLRRFGLASFALLLLILSNFCLRTDQDFENILPEVWVKPVEKVAHSLNSSERESWTLYYGEQDKNAPATPVDLKGSGFSSIPATVPGNVELDLLREGIIEDPMTGDRVYDLRQYEKYQWWYHRTFEKPETINGERIELCFDGIDCIADIWLNNEKIARVENMFVEHHYDVTDLLQKKNQLHIKIYSTVLEARNYMRNNFGVRYDALAEAVSIRKAPHMFGWDILPRLISAGLWRDVKLEVIPATSWRSVYWVTKDVDVASGRANMYVDWDFTSDRPNIDDLVLQIELEKDGTFIYKKTIPLYTTVSRERIWGLENVEFWWPRGFGEAALYNATLRLVDENGAVLCENRQRIGIRKAELELTAVNTHESPGEFVFKVNGEKIFVKGTNWVALDAFHSRDPSHLDEAVGMLADLNCNMIRMWGGNVYESDRFYELCDEQGIMVWQDFTMGCTTYPQEKSFRDKVKVEADKVIRRLRKHPSLVLWAGNNENDVSLDWAGDQTYIDPNTDLISREVLPLAVREWDPKTPYLPSSPFISEEVFEIHNRVTQDLSPERHLWGPRGYYKAPFYTDHNAKFVSEIGYHGCPNVESLQRMMSKEMVYPWVKGENPEKLIWNDEWLCKATITHPQSEINRERNYLMTNQIREVFGEVPLALEDFVAASQIVQAEAKKYFIEFWRMDKGDRNGILWWNLRDGWPVISDAVVDYYGGKKLAYHYIKRVQQDVCFMIGDPKRGSHPVIAVNDTRKNVSGNVVIEDVDSGRNIFEKDFFLEANGKSTLGEIPAPTDSKMWQIQWEFDGTTYYNHYLAYQPPLALEKCLKWSKMINID